METRIKQLEKNLNKLNVQYERLEERIKTKSETLANLRKIEIARTLPKVGQDVYVPEEDRPDYILDDLMVCKGGLAKVESIEPKEDAGWMTVELMGDIHEYRRFSREYIWWDDEDYNLSKQQNELRAKYGINRAKVSESEYDSIQHHKELADLLDW